MNEERIKTEYLCYLMNRAQIEAEGPNGYLKLCEVLLNMEFRPLIEMDENRSSDCMNLRSEFSERYEYPDEAVYILDRSLAGLDGTWMELLVVLAEKMAYDLADSEYEARTGKWFMEMLGNCGLDEETNGVFEDDDNSFKKEVFKIIHAFTVINLRQFGWDGEGGLFPLRWPKRDQRYAELIMQMNDYIEENYDIC